VVRGNPEGAGRGFGFNHKKKGMRPGGRLTRISTQHRIQRYAKQYGNERLEDACARALELSLQPSLRTISAFCITPPPKKDSDDSAARAKATSHGITRGASYFSKGGKRK